jgi:hypothetical protein
MNKSFVSVALFIAFAVGNKAFADPEPISGNIVFQGTGIAVDSHGNTTLGFPDGLELIPPFFSVVQATGDFASITPSDPVTSSQPGPWYFDSGYAAGFFSVGGFTFDLIDSTNPTDGDVDGFEANFLVYGNGYQPTFYFDSYEFISNGATDPFIGIQFGAVSNGLTTGGDGDGTGGNSGGTGGDGGGRRPGGSASVPDGGTTAVLLCLGMVATEFLLRPRNTRLLEGPKPSPI